MPTSLLPHRADAAPFPPPASPLGWSATRRVAVAAAVCLLLWLVTIWALD